MENRKQTKVGKPGLKLIPADGLHCCCGTFSRGMYRLTDCPHATGPILGCRVAAIEVAVPNSN